MASRKWPSGNQKLPNKLDQKSDRKSVSKSTQKSPDPSKATTAPPDRAHPTTAAAGPLTQPKSSRGRAGAAKRGRGEALSDVGRLILDRLDRGVLLLDRQGNVIDSNAAATAVLRSGDGLRIRAGRLAFTDPELDGRFDSLLTKGTKERRRADDTMVVRVRRDKAGECRLVVSRVAEDKNERGIAFTVLIYAPDGPGELSVPLLEKLYGLTKAQAKVAAALFATRSAEGAAQRLELSLNTVRSHLKQIFNKCEVKSQGELMQMLALGPHSL